MRRLAAWLAAVAILVTDFVTKRLVLANADSLRFDRVEVLGDFFRLAYVRNPGAAMGLTPFMAEFVGLSLPLLVPNAVEEYIDACDYMTINILCEHHCEPGCHMRGRVICL